MAGAWPEPGRSLAGAEKKYKKCPNNPAIAPARLRPSSGQWPEYRQPPSGHDRGETEEFSLHEYKTAVQSGERENMEKM